MGYLCCDLTRLVNSEYKYLQLKAKVAWVQDAWFESSEKKRSVNNRIRKNAKNTNMLFQEIEFLPPTFNY